MSKLEQGEIALFKYNKLRFSFANLKAGDQQILTSDPWSLINSHLQQKISRSRGDNKIFLERSLYFSSLAESFYKAANSILLPTRATVAPAPVPPAIAPIPMEPIHYGMMPGNHWGVHD